MTNAQGIPGFIKVIIAFFAIYGVYALIEKMFACPTYDKLLLGHQADRIDELTWENAELHRRARIRTVISDFFAKFFAKLAWEAIKDWAFGYTHPHSPVVLRG